LYIPPHSKLSVFSFVGQAPANKPGETSSWLRKLKTGEHGSGKKTMGGGESGEFTFSVQFEQVDDQWSFWTEGPQWRNEIPREFNRWMSDRDRWYPASGVSSRRQMIVEPGEPIMLLCVQERNEMGTDGKAGDTIVLWIDVDE
jgi:hypothetical protein